ncbi:MAG: Eco57I restriction-modification methylase domain-containing protein [Promethearchaeota archaeon]
MPPVTKREFKPRDINIIEINKWIEECKANFNFAKLPAFIHSEDEFILSYLAGYWLLHFFNNKLIIKSANTAFEIIEKLKKDIPKSNCLWEFIHKIFTAINEKDCLNSLLSIEIPDIQDLLDNDTLGTLLQQSLDFEDRKTLAANYTTFNSAQLLIELINTGSFKTIIDPFCGSGRLISAYLENLSSKDQFPSIRIHDLMPSAVLIAYCRIILKLSECKQDFRLVQASIGDAFATFSSSLETEQNVINKYDLVLMNPPFTRIHRIDNNQRKNLSKIEQYYKQYLRGQVGLHIYAFLLADMLVKEDGVVGAILPAATILSQYSSGVQELLLKNYQLKAITSPEDKKAYSEDSSFREIMLIAKNKTPEKNTEIQFIRFLDTKRSLEQPFSTHLVPREELAKEWNWTIFLKDPELLNFRKTLLRSGLIKSGKKLHLDIVRGIEMYGPNFFFVPNRKWASISETEEEVIIKCEENTLKIPKRYIIRSLRKPGKYTQFISPQVEDFALSIPNSELKFQKWIEDYTALTEHYASPAKSKFGSEWISHIHKQIKIKKPWGHLFFIDKFSISSTGVMGHFLETKHICSKNFYVLRSDDVEYAKLLAAWLNSSFFIVLFLLSRREIGGSFGRLQIIDYLKEPLFLDVSKILSSQKNQIIREFDILRRIQLPMIPEQLKLPQRKALDLAILQGFHFSKKVEKKILSNIYVLLGKTFKILQRRDRAQNPLK